MIGGKKLKWLDVISNWKQWVDPESMPDDPDVAGKRLKLKQRPNDMTKPRLRALAKHIAQSFSNSPPSNPFCFKGNWFVQPDDSSDNDVDAKTTKPALKKAKAGKKRPPQTNKKAGSKSVKSRKRRDDSDEDLPSLSADEETESSSSPSASDSEEPDSERENGIITHSDTELPLQASPAMTLDVFAKEPPTFQSDNLPKMDYPCNVTVDHQDFINAEFDTDQIMKTIILAHQKLQGKVIRLKVPLEVARQTRRFPDTFTSMTLLIWLSGQLGKKHISDHSRPYGDQGSIVNILIQQLGSWDHSIPLAHLFIRMLDVSRFNFTENTSLSLGDITKRLGMWVKSSLDVISKNPASVDIELLPVARVIAFLASIADCAAGYDEDARLWCEEVSRRMISRIYYLSAALVLVKYFDGALCSIAHLHCQSEKDVIIRPIWTEVSMLLLIISKDLHYRVQKAWTMEDTDLVGAMLCCYFYVEK
ncbi:hypothetical protein FRC03_005877 [Tulasnella sp. 419]|nr:hypothetical protein FRC03_005877 [Tulasnella sp. 419]